MKLIVGLGNPGSKYRNTRHNAGYMVVNALAEEHSISIKKKAYNGLLGEGRVGRNKVFLLLPETYMNLSGVSVAQAKGLVEDISDILVVHDDIDLSLGSIRFRPGGSSGGQKGVKSVIDALGTQDFARLRIGIRPSFNDFAIAEYVLETFSGDEKITMEEVIKASVSGIETWVNEGLDKCMTKHNKKNTAE